MSDERGKVSNYDIMRDRMEREFAKYDQDEMIRKFSLAHDARYLYIRLLGLDYRIQRDTGRVERIVQKDGSFIHADYTESMILFDMLAWSAPGCSLCGVFVPANKLKGTIMTAAPVGGFFERRDNPFAGRVEALRRACGKLGATPGTVGDVSCVLPLFDFFPVMLQFWDADEEFDAVLKFMWDANAEQFMHYETICFAMGHIVRRLQQVMAEEED